LRLVKMVAEGDYREPEKPKSEVVSVGGVQIVEVDYASRLPPKELTRKTLIGSPWSVRVQRDRDLLHEGLVLASRERGTLRDIQYTLVNEPDWDKPRAYENKGMTNLGFQFFKPHDKDGVVIRGDAAYLYNPMLGVQFSDSVGKAEEIVAVRAYATTIDLRDYFENLSDMANHSAGYDDGSSLDRILFGHHFENMVKREAAQLWEQRGVRVNAVLLGEVTILPKFKRGDPFPSAPSLLAVTYLI
jgi:hypothetical protein